jgi:intracellular sulfur oxidation DsrE/DsrF family protein
MMKQRKLARRALIAGAGATAAGLTVGRIGLGAQALAVPAPPAASTFQPARHEPDAWFDTLRGQHRVIIDTVTADGVTEAMMFANNVLAGNRSGYELSDGDIALVVCLRHYATAFAFSDTIWAKYGKALASGARFTPQKPDEIPTVNPRNAAPRTPLTALAKRGVHFAICNMATQRISRQSAGSDGDAASIYKELIANALPNGHFMAAGVVAVTRAQEYGYSLLHAG